MLVECPHMLSVVALDYPAHSQYRALLGGAAEKFEDILWEIEKG